MPFFENYIWPIMHCNFFFEKHLYMLSCDSAQCSKKNFCKELQNVYFAEKLRDGVDFADQVGRMP